MYTIELSKRRFVNAKSLMVTLALLLAMTLAGPAQALTWDIATVDSSGMVGWWTSIAVDASDDPHISYYDRANGNLKYAGKFLPRYWALETVDSEGNVGQMTSLALDSSGSPHISYLEFAPMNRNLKYARKLASGGWSTETVDSEGDVGWFASIALDSSGNPHISYYDFTNFADGNLKYARKLPFGGWSIETVDFEGNVGGYTSIALDSNGNPHISYYDWGNATLKYARKSCSRVPFGFKTGTVGTGTATTYCFWTKETVDPGDVTGGLTSIALDSSGLPHISYTVFGGGYPAVKYARKSTSGSWSLETVDTGGVGSFTSIALDSSGLPHMSYTDATHGNLRYARKLASGGWSRETVDTEESILGGHNSIALDSSDNPHISYEDLNGHLKYAKGHPGWIINGF